MAGTWSGSTYTGDDGAETVTAGAGSHYIYGRGGADSLDGGAGNDYLYGEEGDDTLIGGTGNDVLTGGNGADSLLGGSGNDAAWVSYGPGFAGKDTVDGGTGTDELQIELSTTGSTGTADISKAVEISLGATPVFKVAGVSAATITLFEKLSIFASNWLGNIKATGGAEDDFFLTGAGKDTLSGGDGDDTFETGAGNDSLRGGTGNDTASGGAGNDTIKGDAGNDLLSDGDKNLSSSYAYATIPGTDNDSIEGGDGNDGLSSYFGTDTLLGGAGNDQLWLTFGRTIPAGAVLDGGTGTDGLHIVLTAPTGTAVLGHPVTVTLGATTKLVVNGTTIMTATSMESLDIRAETSTGAIKATGGALNDKLWTGGGKDSLVGGSGDDDINSTGGADTVVAGAGADSVHVGFDKNVSVDMGSGNDSLSIYGGNGDDATRAVGGLLYQGGSGTDRLFLSSGNVALNWNVDTATLGGKLVGQFQSFESFTIYGGSGNDTITGGALADNLNGGTGNDTIKGGSGNDSLYANNGSDSVDGGEGNDNVSGTFDTGTVDTLKGGNGTDQIFFFVSYYSPAIKMTGDLQGGSVVSIDGVKVGSLYGFESAVITGGSGDDTILGAEGADTIRSNSGADSITTGDGNDLIELDFGKVVGSTVSKDTVSMGGGTKDLLSGSLAQGVTGDVVMSGSFAGTLTFRADANTILTATGVEQLSLRTEGGIFAEVRDDILFGGGLGDTLDAGAGTNDIKGNGGNDELTVRVDQFRDVVDGGAGDDILNLNGLGQTVAFKMVWTAGVLSVKRGSTEVVKATTIELVNVDGTEGADSLVGGDGNDTISGGGGLDTLIGGGGNDYITGKPVGKESMDGGSGNDTLTGYGGGDTIDGGSGVDFARIGNGLGVTVTLDGANDAEVTSGGVVVAVLRNVEGVEGSYDVVDILTGDSKANLFYGHGGKDVIDGKGGIDTVNFAYSDEHEGVSFKLNGATAATVSGTYFAGTKLINIENIVGSVGTDDITGDKLANNIDGSFGSDTLSGGLGKDTLTGGSLEVDHFRFLTAAAAANVDTITDFEHGMDRLEFENAVFTALGTSITSTEFLAAASGHAATASTHHLIYDKSNGTLWYDADGNKSGGVTAVQVAQLGTTATHPTNLTYTDFGIV